MPELERTLTRLGAELDWPETPDLAASVTARLAQPAGEARAEAAPGGPPAAPRPRADSAGGPPAAPRPRRRFGLPAARRPLRRRGLPAPAGLRRSLALALVGLLVLAGTVFAAVPGVRDAVLEFFGLQGATVERRETLPTPPPERPLDLGARTTLDAARDRLAFEPLVPADPGQPDAVYLRSSTPGGELSLAYRARPGLPRGRITRLGLLVSQFRGDLSPEYFGKLADPSVEIEPLEVDGRRGIWIEGAPHFFFYRTPDGTVIDSELRLAENVLLLERGRLLVRVEGAMERDRALAIARSLR